MISGRRTAAGPDNRPGRALLPLFLAALCLAPLFCCLWPQAARTGQSPVTSEERIILFDVRAGFEPDGSMRVSENITVYAAGRDIKRGIMREIPLQWDRADNKRFMLSCEVLGVSRDGRPEPYTRKQDNKELSLRIGNPQRALERGEHTYCIEYVLRNHFSRFEQWDELYYNVTGNGWRLPISRVHFRLDMPAAGYYGQQTPDIGAPPPGVRRPGAAVPPPPFYSIDVYTGYAGERGQEARVINGEARSVSGLVPGQGLTVAYTWPRWVLRDAPDPVEYSPLRKALAPRLESLPMFAAPLLLVLFYACSLIRQRCKHGSRAPAVIPLFAPPEGLTPGQLRFALTGRYGNAGFAADILRLVSLGAINLEKIGADKKGFWKRKANALTLELADGAEELTDKDGRKLLGERDVSVLNRLFSEGGRVYLDTVSQRSVRAAKSYLEGKAGEERGALYTGYKKQLLLCIPALLAVALVARVLLRRVGYETELFFVAIMVTGFIAMFSGVVLFLTGRALGRPGSFEPLNLFRLCWMLPFWAGVVFMAVKVAPIVMGAAIVPDGFFLALALCLLPLPFYSLLAVKRTALGRERLAQARGMVMYMAAAEKRRLEALYPPDLSVEHFEKLLPYAFALGVGETWAATFAGYLAEVGAEAGHFRDFSWHDARGLAYGLGGASAAPGGSSFGSGGSGSSGSGSGGGGSSGGGSGGGGGGGW